MVVNNIIIILYSFNGLTAASGNLVFDSNILLLLTIIIKEHFLRILEEILCFQVLGSDGILWEYRRSADITPDKTKNFPSAGWDPKIGSPGLVSLLVF